MREREAPARAILADRELVGNKRHLVRRSLVRGQEEAKQAVEHIALSNLAAGIGAADVIENDKMEGLTVQIAAAFVDCGHQVRQKSAVGVGFALLAVPCPYGRLAAILREAAPATRQQGRYDEHSYQAPAPVATCHTAESFP